MSSPRNPRRGKKTVIKRKQLDNLRVSYPQWYNSNNASANPESNLSNNDLNAPGLVEQVRRPFCQAHGTWDTGRTGGTYCTITGIDWAALARPLAEGECRAIGYPRIRGSITSADIVDPGPPIQGEPRAGTLGIQPHTQPAEHGVASPRAAVPLLQRHLRKENPPAPLTAAR